MPNIIDEILNHPKPGDLASWWAAAGKAHPERMSGALEDEERAYLEFYTSGEVPAVLQIGRGVAKAGHLDAHDLERAKALFGDGPTSRLKYANYENRRRIVAHYALTHPATIALQIEQYRLVRDVNPVTFVGERIYQLFTGEEAFTGHDISRAAAAVELAAPILVARALRLVRVAGPTQGPARALTDPIYDLPPEGGGMRINGRWYTEHALERMAPNTPAVRAELRTRAIKRLHKLGLREGTEIWDACMAKALKKVDPRGVPPSVVEAEIMRPGSTNVVVVTARQKSVVVTVKPRK